MPEPPPTENDANDIVKKKKYVSATFLDRSTTHADATVFLEGREDIGLKFCIRPCEKTIGTSLTWNKWRIRGINRKMGHKRCDGKKIKGWHQHIWKQQCGDRWVEPLAKELFGSPPDPDKVIKFSFKIWNIKPIGGIGQQFSFDFLEGGKANGGVS